MSLTLFQRFAAAACLSVLIPCAHAALPLAEPVPVSAQIRTGKLDNGLTFLIRHNAQPRGKLELRLVVKAGSVQEDESQQGLAHFTEHMAFNGTTHFKKQEMTSYLQSIGVQIGRDMNALTNFNDTVYMLPIPTGKRDDVDKGFLMLKDIAQGMTMHAEDIDEERGVLLEELRGRKGAGDRIQRALAPKLFNGSLYAQRLPGGKEEVLRNFKHEDIRRFYKDWYRPDLMAVIAVGDFDPAQAEALIRKYFTDLKNPASPRPRDMVMVPQLAASEALVATDKEANGNLVMIRYPLMAPASSLLIGDYRPIMQERLFHRMLNQRLQEVPQGKDTYLEGAVTIEKLPSQQRALTLRASPSQGGAAPAIDALVKESTRVHQFGFTTEELERAKKSLMRIYETAYAERDKTDSAVHVRELIRHFTEQESIPGVEAEFGYVKQIIPAIGVDEVNQLARTLLQPGTPKLVFYIGTTNGAAPAPTAPELLEAVRSAEQLKVRPKVERAVAASLMGTLPAAGQVSEQWHDARLGLTHLTLSNGLKVILKPTDFRNDQVLMGASRPGGQSLFADADRINARYAHSLVNSMGLHRFSPADLQQILTGKVAGAATSMNMYSDAVSASSSAADIETMLQLVHLRFTGPRRSIGVFNSYITRQKEQARNLMAQPQSVLVDTLIGSTYGDHARAPLMPRPDDFASLDLERSFAIYRERFSSAYGFTFIFVGNFDVDKLKPLLATYLASLPTGTLPLKFKDIGLYPASGVVTREVRKGTEAKSTVMLKFHGAAEHTEIEQLRLDAVSVVLNMRVSETLREKLALLYSGRVTGQMMREPKPMYTLDFFLPTGPEKVEELIKATFAEIERLKLDGPSAAELTKVKQNWLQQHQKAVRDNHYWLGRIQSSVLYGADLADIATFEQRANAINAIEIRDAARRFLSNKNYVQVVLNPESR